MEQLMRGQQLRDKIVVRKKQDVCQLCHEEYYGAYLHLYFVSEHFAKENSYWPYVICEKCCKTGHYCVKKNQRLISVLHEFLHK